LNKTVFDQFNGKITLNPQNTKVSGDLAFDEGTFTTVMTPKAGGLPITDEGRYVVILQRETDGWKVIEDIGNVSKVAPAPEPPNKPAVARKAPAKAPATKSKTKTR
jgi:ketosteroid isomerase-like protein